MNSSKTLDFEQNAPISKHTIPELIADTEILVKKLSKLSMSDISSLMKVSEKLAQLNFERYAGWQTHVKGSGAKQALLAFKGDIYSGIEVDNYKRKEFDFAQKHL
ncbi:MAG: peroxide stress protein YaaA, partial [Desulfobacterales bacterium]